MKKHFLIVAIASSLFVAFGANAMTESEYDVAKTKVEAAYKVDKAKCDQLKGNANDVCDDRAKGKMNVAKAELEQSYKPSNDHAADVQEAKIKMAYNVADEKCDSMSGEPKNNCQKQAKMQRDKSMEEMKKMKR